MYEAKEQTKKSSLKEELELACSELMIQYYNGNTNVFNKEKVIENLNQCLSTNKIEKATIYYNTSLVNEDKLNEVEEIYKLESEEESKYFTISNKGELNYLQSVKELVQENDANGISLQAGKWVSYSPTYLNQAKDYSINAALEGWRILSNDNNNTKIVTAGIPARYEYNHNKTIVDDWNDFSKFENITFTWGMSNIKQLKEEKLAIGIRSINYKDIKEVTNSTSYIPAYSNSMWGSEEWPTRLRGLIGCDNEYIIATWQNQEKDNLYYMKAQDKYGMVLNSNGYLYYLGVRVVAYLNENVHVYESEYFNGSSKNQPLLLIL